MKTSELNKSMKDSVHSFFKRMKDALYPFAKRVRDAVYPKDIKCINCSKELFAPAPFSLCAECASSLEFIKTRCTKCGSASSENQNSCKECNGRNFKYMAAWAPLVYNRVARNLVLRLKANGEKYLADYMTEIMLPCYKEFNTPFDLIAAVPVSAKTRKRRGFNQSELLAESLAEKTGLACEFGALIKASETPLQVGKSRNERLENLKGAFSVTNPSAFYKKRILLVDDVLTTTATANEIAEEILKAGAKSVTAIAFARACML